MLRSDRFGPLVGGVGLAAVLALVAALAFRSEGLLPWALALAGGEYAAFLAIREGSIDGYAPIYGAGLLLVAELASWSIERRVGVQRGEGLIARRATLLIVVCVAAGGVGGLILAMAEASVGGGVWLEALGVAAAVGSLGLLARLARPEP
jgi:hypothetical protein